MSRAQHRSMTDVCAALLELTKSKARCAGSHQCPIARKRSGHRGCLAERNRSRGRAISARLTRFLSKPNRRKRRRPLGRSPAADRAKCQSIDPRWRIQVSRAATWLRPIRAVPCGIREGRGTDWRIRSSSSSLRPAISNRLSVDSWPRSSSEFPFSAGSVTILRDGSTKF